ncbi:MAG: cohesin domain-containing protein [Euryarchaeota archaeon]|nr:cohesin domain-containing protein [Euryarchaeota archaeon]
MKMKEEIGKSSARMAVLLALIAIAVAAFTVLPVLVSAAQEVEVRVNAPAYVAGTFNATIDVDNVTDLNSGQFDLSFNSSVVNVTEVKAGEIDGVAVPIFMWHFFDADTVRVLISMPMVVGANGSGSLAEIEFEVKGKGGEKSTLNISNEMLVDTKAKKIDAEWYDDEVTVLGTVVSVNAPAYVEETFNVTIDVANVTDLSSGQFDLSFNSSVVNVTEVKEGGIDGVAVPIFMWNFFDADTVRVLVSMPMDMGANGSGSLAEIEFEVKGNSGEKSTLDLSNRQLVDAKAKKIDAEWYGDEVTVL